MSGCPKCGSSVITIEVSSDDQTPEVALGVRLCCVECNQTVDAQIGGKGLSDRGAVIASVRRPVRIEDVIRSVAQSFFEMWSDGLAEYERVYGRAQQNVSKDVDDNSDPLAGLDDDVRAHLAVFGRTPGPLPRA